MAHERRCRLSVTVVGIAKRGKTHLNVSWGQNPVSRHRQSITISILIFINSPGRIGINSRSLRGSAETTREPSGGRDTWQRVSPCGALVSAPD